MAFLPSQGAAPTKVTVTATQTLTHVTVPTTYEVDTTSAAVTLTLPAATGSNIPLTIDWVAGSNTLALALNGSDTYDTTLPTLAQGSSITLRDYASTKWVIN